MGGCIKMARRVFYSFHYLPDNWRASQVRNIGVVEGNLPARDNDWETIKRGGDKTIKHWIDTQLYNRSCTIVLIGENTAGRKWINYEVIKSWNEGKGILGIYIHNLKDSRGQQAKKGTNPFDEIFFEGSKRKLSSVVKAYDPPYKDSKHVYNYLCQNISNWIEEAIQIRIKS